MRLVLELGEVEDPQRLAEVMAWTATLARARGPHGVAVMLRADEEVAALREALAQVLPPEAVRVWAPPVDEREGPRVEALRMAVLASLAPGAVQVPRPAGAPQALRALWEEQAGASGAKPAGRPQLAYVSPWPPERSGVADYSAELLPALEAHYEVIPVAAQEGVRLPAPWRERVRHISWLQREGAERVLYHVGNSFFHRYMPALLEEVPGVVVLHDFFLGDLFAWLEAQGGVEGAWSRALLDSHGHPAVRLRRRDPEAARWRFPANWPVISMAEGVIVHSEHARTLAQQWYGEGVGGDWAVIPHLRMTAGPRAQSQAKAALGFAPDDFVVCSFGFLTPAKLCERIVAAWGASSLARERGAFLVFVGEAGGDYGQRLAQVIRESGLRDRVRITGYAPPDSFRLYLQAADVAIQLRANSRGESSGTVLDCMAQGVATIVNAHGSMAELDASAVWRLPDEFTDASLVEALETLWRDPARREALAARARETIALGHTPQHCAARYAEAIERFHARAQRGLRGAVRAIAQMGPLPLPRRRAWAQALAVSLPELRPGRRLWLDVTATVRHDLRTGIERTVRSLTGALLEEPPLGMRAVPVVLDHSEGRWVYREANAFALRVLGEEAPPGLADEIVLPQAGDTVLTLDLGGGAFLEALRSGFFSQMRGRGIRVMSVVYDLLPVRRPEVFPPGTDESFAAWLEGVNAGDGALCISRTVAEDLRRWRAQRGLDGGAPGRLPFRIGWFHLGADLEHSAPTSGLPEQAEAVLAALRARPTFLMVGTVEPRKGYGQVLAAFDRLWAQGVEVNLAIVGREGWVDLPAAQRRDIPETVRRLRAHPQRGQRLFWLEGISDEFLEAVYGASVCLLAASYDEGFGLPLIEAARRGVPILARDIAIFREVAGAYAAYFSGESPEMLAEAVLAWMEAFREGRHPRPEGLPWQTWAESARAVASFVLASDSPSAGAGGTPAASG